MLNKNSEDKEGNIRSGIRFLYSIAIQTLSLLPWNYRDVAVSINCTYYDVDSKSLQIFLTSWYTALAKQLMPLPSLGIAEFLVQGIIKRSLGMFMALLTAMVQLEQNCDKGR